MSNEKERKIKPGELQNVLASEEVTRRNVQSGIQFANDTRKMVLELGKLFDTLQNHVMNQRSEISELRRQLAFVQQKLAARGTKSYDDGD